MAHVLRTLPFSVVGLAVGIGVGVWVGRSATEQNDRGPVRAEQQTDMDATRRELASCKDERRGLEGELAALRRSTGAGANVAALQLAAAASATAADAPPPDNRKRGGGPREPAAAADDPRTEAWVQHVVGDLALSGRQKAELTELAKWAADQRNALREKALKEGLDSEAVRAEIAEQRAEYEKRMRALLSADEWLAFDAVQGVERRPPTFARMPDILGEQAQPLTPQSQKDAGG